MKKVERKFSALVVDDDQMIRKVEEKLLASFGLETKVVNNGEEALKLFLEGYTFDVVVMDMEMPVKNGPEVDIVNLINVTIFQFFFIE